MKKLIAMLLVLITLTATACAEELTVYYWGDERDIDAAFLAAHPGVTLAKSRMVGSYPWTASEMAGKMLTREFDYDVFYVGTSDHLPQDIIDKGYALDLSGSEIVREAVARMHPAIQAQAVRDGKIYALPYAVAFNPKPMVCNPEAWEALGYTEADIPQSFPEFLDFLNAWVERQRQNPQDEYWVFNSMDVTVYTSSYYTYQLTQLLMENYILQKQFAGEPLTFDEPELLALLKRVRETGAAIYSIETVKEESMGRVGTALFMTEMMGSRMDEADIERWQVPLRLNREQPVVVSGEMSLAMVYAGTDTPELAIDYIESIVQNNTDNGHRWADSTLYTDGQPIVNEKQADDIRHWSNLIALAEHRLANDKTPYTEYMDLEGWTQQQLNNYAHNAAEAWDWSDSQTRDFLDSWHWYLDQAIKQEYLFSPEALAAWQRFIQRMYFPEPSAFSSSTDVGVNFYSLMDQFAEGTISAEQLVQEAARIAWMVEMENQSASASSVNG